MLSRLSIRARLVGIAILFLVPIALQVYLFVDQSRKDITFADKEVAGVVYLRSAWPVLHALAAAVSDPALQPGRQAAVRAEARSRRQDLRRRDGQRAGQRRSRKTLAAVELAEPGGRVPATRPTPRSRPRAR